MTREQRLADFDSKNVSLAQLLALDLEVANRIETCELVTAPGVPKEHSALATLVTKDCITPART
jgi:hypothetical protein